MIILEPLSKERIWGTSNLHEYAGSESIKKIGSVYSVSGIEGLSNKIINHEKYTDLYEAIQKEPELFGLEDGMEYPVIISFTGCDEDLSIQVHPTDDFARKKENKKIGKSESWYFLEEPDSKWIYAESLLTDKDKIKELINNGKFEKVVDKKSINKNDLVFIQSGTLHALTSGSIVYEIQQSTDITYRFFDYNRVDSNGKKRDLHLDKAIATLDVDNKIKVSNFDSDKVIKELPYSLFKSSSLNKYSNDKSIAEALTVIKGAININNFVLRQGESCIILPNEQVEIDFESDSEIIIATPNIYF